MRVNIRVIDLIPGDVVRNGTMTATYITQTVHPIWPSLQLVIWRLSDGEWSFDALRPEQVVGDAGNYSASENPARLRQALLGEGSVS